MEALRTFLRTNWLSFLIPISALAGTLIAGWIVKRFVFRALAGWVAKTKFRADDILVEAIRKPFMIWALILGLYLAASTTPLRARPAALLGKVLLILWVLSLAVAGVEMARNVIRQYSRELQGTVPITSLTENITTLSIYIIFGLILLDILGISITPILTALGVGGLAVALALQDTLANLFAGLYVSVAGQIRLGDYVKLDSGIEGYVADITWRSTTIRALANNLIIVPNSKLAQAIVTNYHLPEKRMSLSIPIGVSYDCDPDEVERILVDEAVKGARDIPGLLGDPAPAVRLIPGYGESSLNFTLTCQVAEFVDQYLVQHELRKRIFRRFRGAGIEIPFPTRTVHLRREANEAGPVPPGEAP